MKSRRHQTLQRLVAGASPHDSQLIQRNFPPVKREPKSLALSINFLRSAWEILEDRDMSFSRSNARLLGSSSSSAGFREFVDEALPLVSSYIRSDRRRRNIIVLKEK